MLPRTNIILILTPDSVPKRGGVPRGDDLSTDMPAAQRANHDKAPMNHDEAAAPLVSVIIPCYNQAHFLDSAIQSVLAQTYPHCEIIVVDDGSQDDTATAAAQYPDIRYFWQPNSGLSSARNTGIRMSRGHYLVFLDSDDRLLPDALQTGVNCLHANPECAFVSGHYRYIRADGSIINEYPQPPIDADHYKALLSRNYIGMHATVMYRREIFDILGGFNPALRSCEDYDLYFRVARSYPVFHHDRVIAEYRRHDSSMSLSPGRMLKSALVTLRGQWGYIRGNPDYIRAYIAGIRSVRRSARQPLMSSLYKNLQAGQWCLAGRLLSNATNYPWTWLQSRWYELCAVVHLILGAHGER